MQLTSEELSKYCIKIGVDEINMSTLTQLLNFIGTSPNELNGLGNICEFLSVNQAFLRQISPRFKITHIGHLLTTAKLLTCTKFHSNDLRGNFYFYKKNLKQLKKDITFEHQARYKLMFYTSTEESELFEILICYFLVLVYSNLSKRKIETYIVWAYSLRLLSETTIISELEHLSNGDYHEENLYKYLKILTNGPHPHSESLVILRGFLKSCCIKSEKGVHEFNLSRHSSTTQDDHINTSRGILNLLSSDSSLEDNEHLFLKNNMLRDKKEVKTRINALESPLPDFKDKKVRAKYIKTIKTIVNKQNVMQDCPTQLSKQQKENILEERLSNNLENFGFSPLDKLLENIENSDLNLIGNHNENSESNNHFTTRTSCYLLNDYNRQKFTREQHEAKNAVNTHNGINVLDLSEVQTYKNYIIKSQQHEKLKNIEHSKVASLIMLETSTSLKSAWNIELSGHSPTPCESLNTLILDLEKGVIYKPATFKTHSKRPTHYDQSMFRKMAKNFPIFISNELIDQLRKIQKEKKAALNNRIFMDVSFKTIEKQFESYLIKLNSLHGSNIKLSNLRSFVPDQMSKTPTIGRMQAAYCKVEIDNFEEITAKYTAIECTQLTTNFIKTQSNQFYSETIIESEKQSIIDPYKDYSIGSQLVPTVEGMKKIIDIFLEDIEKSNYSNTPFHARNAHANYLCMRLLLETAFRNVKKFLIYPFDLDPTQGSLSIFTDKELLDHPYRLSLISNPLKKSINDFHKRFNSNLFLDAERLIQFDPEFNYPLLIPNKKHLDEINERDQWPPLFALIKNGTPEKITANSIYRYFQMHYQVNANIFRHFMCSELSKSNLDLSIIKAFIGHKSHNTDAFSGYSRLLIEEYESEIKYFLDQTNKLLGLN